LFQPETNPYGNRLQLYGDDAMPRNFTAEVKESTDRPFVFLNLEGQHGSSVSLPKFWLRKGASLEEAERVAQNLNRLIERIDIDQP
jgi:hypothetical protein